MAAVVAEMAADEIAIVRVQVLTLAGTSYVLDINSASSLGALRAAAASAAGVPLGSVRLCLEEQELSGEDVLIADLGIVSDTILTLAVKRPFDMTGNWSENLQGRSAPTGTWILRMQDDKVIGVRKSPTGDPDIEINGSVELEPDGATMVTLRCSGEDVGAWNVTVAGRVDEEAIPVGISGKCSTTTRTWDLTLVLESAVDAAG